MEHKTFKAVLLKSDAAQGIVEHLIAVMGNEDLGGDIIHPGAFTKTISERMGKIRVLDQHRTDSVLRVVGKPLEMREMSRAQLPDDLLKDYPTATGALYAKTQYLMDTPEGAGVFARISSGAIDEYSIGYDPLPADTDYSTVTSKDGKKHTVRNLRAVKLYEYSPVLWGMNQATSTLSAKAADDAPSEGKPWDVFKVGDKWHVYKIDDDGKRTGDSLGEHDSESDARAQVRALYANEKAVNLTELVRDVTSAFNEKYSQMNNDMVQQYPHFYCVHTVFDDHLIVRDMYDDNEEYYNVAYSVADGKYVFAEPSEWIEGHLEFVADAETQTQVSVMSEGKVGRIFASRNETRLREAYKLLKEALDELDRQSESEDESASEGGSGKSSNSARSSTTPTEDDNAVAVKSIDIELEYLQIIGV